MTTKFASPFKDGATIQVAYGVLRGVGPMGPRGHTGPPGSPGPQGIPGPQPEMVPVAGHFERASAMTITNTGAWVAIAMTGNSYLLGNVATLNVTTGAITIVAGAAGSSLIYTPKVTITAAAGDTVPFQFELGLFEGTAGSPFTSCTFTHSRGVVSADYAFSSQQLIMANTEVTLKIRVWAAVSPVVNSSFLKVARTGGPVGPVGPQGIQGIQGLQGATGLPGASGTGYPSMDALDNAGDSDALPPGSLVTNQALPYPVGTMPPAIPAYLKFLAEAASKKVVRRFATVVDAMNAPDNDEGQIGYLDDYSAVYVRSKVNGTVQQMIIPQIIYGTGDPPSTTHPAGTIYLKVI
jgi:hypothetical protein